MGKRKKQAKVLRIFRKVHRTTGALLFIFFFFISISGLILGWKKNSNGYILPKTQKGTTADLKKWLPVDSLHTIAITTIQNEFRDRTLEVDIHRNKNLNVLFDFLNKQKIYVMSMRNKANRLEELFLNLTSQRKNT